MGQSKKDIVNDLYALRAGLSAISQECDNLRQCVREANEEYEQEMSAEYNQYVTDFVSTHDVSEPYCLNDHLTKAKVWTGNTYNEDGTKRVNYNDTHYEQAYQLQSLTQIYASKNEEKKRAGVIGFFSALFAAGTIVKIYYAVVNSLAPNKNGDIIALFALFGGLCGLITIGLFIWFILELENIKYSSKMSNIYNEMIALYPEWKRNVAGIISRVDTQMSAKLQAKIATIVKKGCSVYVALQENFEDLIDIRDWKHLDLIIYYLETGRADTMKEALQLVEREIQTERIVEAIETAARQICMTISMAAERISGRLDTLSSQLTLIAVQRHMHLALDGRLIEATEMQNALLAKAHMDSEALIQEVEYFKKISY